VRGTQQTIIAAHMSRQFGTGVGHAMDEPSRTMMADGGGKSAVVAAFLQKYYGQSLGQEVDGPLHTVATRDTFGLVTVSIDDQPYAIADIGMRMLTPREQFRAQGFPDSYQINTGADGKHLTKTEQTRMCGNSVCPPLAAALARANAGHLAMKLANA
jgi:DNA (cytosine-5)-methyltransferase 1